MNAAEDLGQVMGNSSERLPPPSIMRPTPAALYAALVDAQAHAQAVAKDSTNSFHRYRYASAEAMIAEARQALNTAGLALFAVGWTFEPAAADAVDQAVSGVMRVDYRLVHKSGESLDMCATTPVLPEKGRPQDKAEATALTYNLGYFLRALLLLPREEEDANPDRRDDRERAPPPRQPAAPAQRAAPAPADPRTVFVIPGGKSKGTPLAQASMEALDYWEKRITQSLESGQAQQPDRDKLLRDALREEISKREAGTAALGSSIAGLPKSAPTDDLGGRL